MRILVGDILKSKAQTLINTVNSVGVMGKGIALEFKNRFPDMYEDYVHRCQRGEVKPGLPYLYKTLFPPQIINFPTKDHWKSISKLSDIDRGLQQLVERYREWGVTSLAIPPLGCGNGQLEWRVVGPLIYRFVKDMGIPVEMYAPYGTHPKELTVEFLGQGVDRHAEPAVKNGQSTLNPAWVALVEILARIEQEPYHWPIGRTLFQKIAYVATNEGLPTGLHYQRSSFGPFSGELKALEAKLVNNGLLQEERRGKMFMVLWDRTSPAFGRSMCPSLSNGARPSTRQRICLLESTPIKRRSSRRSCLQLGNWWAKGENCLPRLRYWKGSCIGTEAASCS
jgi:O-acetyl-ADP-ribose deacetylase (regulator of RNase III)